MFIFWLVSISSDYLDFSINMYFDIYFSFILILVSNYSLVIILVLFLVSF